MSLAVKAKEQYLIGHYAESIETFRQVEKEIMAYTRILTDVMENGEPSDFEVAEKIYSDWEKTLTLLQEEFQIVRSIQETCNMFKTMNVATTTTTMSDAPCMDAPPTVSASSPSYASSAAPSAVSRLQPSQSQSQSDADLQAQLLAQQAATDIRDPDVWPPPTTEAPVRRTRVSSVGGAWPNRHREAPARTPMKAPQPALSRDNSQEEESQQSSARLPDWANKKSSASSVSAAPVRSAAPKVARKISNPPPASSSSSSSAKDSSISAPPKRGLAAAAPARKPAVPTAGRKSVAHARKGSAQTAAKEEEPQTEEGGRPKYEAASKEEQEMADLIEREILDKKPNVKMADIAGLAGVRIKRTHAGT